MFMFHISLAVLLSVALLLSENKLQVEANQCYSNSGCSVINYYCCKQRYSWQSSVCRYGGCVGQSCRSDSDCGGPGECCTSNVCTKSGCNECSSNSDCDYNKYCCKQKYYWQSHVCRYGGCVGQSCSSNSDCGVPGECCNSSNYCTKSPCDECSSNSDCGHNKYCCKQAYSGNQICRYGGCVGQSCRLNSDCGGPGECCSSNNVCTKSGCNECSSNWDCDHNKYCCKQRYSLQTNVCGSGDCVGQSCSSDSDCGGPGECCNSTNYCTKSPCDECSSNFDCGLNEHCCKQRYSWQRHVCGSGGCVGQSCSSDSDCGGPGECCSPNNVCTTSSCTNLKAITATNGCFSNSDCPGFYNYCCRTKYIHESHCSSSCYNKSCSSDSDCGGPGECCNSSNYCTEPHNCHHHVTKGLASWLIGVIVVSFLVAVVILIVIVVCFYRGMASASRGRTQQGQVLNQPPGSTIALQNIRTVQNNPVQPRYSHVPYFDQGQGQDIPPQEPALNQGPPPPYTEY